MIRADTVCRHSSVKQSINYINSTKVKLFPWPPSSSFCHCLILSLTHPSIPRITNTRSDTHKVQWSRTHLATQPVNLTLLCGLAAGRHRLCPVFLLVPMWGYTQDSMRSCRAGAGNIHEKGWDRGRQRKKGEKEQPRVKLNKTRETHVKHAKSAGCGYCCKTWKVVWSIMLSKLKRFQLLVLWAVGTKDMQGSHRYQEQCHSTYENKVEKFNRTPLWLWSLKV